MMIRHFLYEIAIAVFLVIAGGAHADNQSFKPPIVNGHDVTRSAPWVVALSQSSKDVLRTQFCGGSLIAPDTVITAAHCVIEVLQKPYEIVVTADRARLSSPEGLTVPVKGIVLHPQFNIFTNANDVAIIKLERAILISSYAALPSSSFTYDSGKRLSLYGWGYTTQNYRTQADMLQEAEIPIIPDDQCFNAFGESFFLNAMFCAGKRSSSSTAGDGVDSCNGDSGGPIGYWEGDSFVLTGLTSWGYECASDVYYGVYTRLTTYTDWILSDPEIPIYPINKPKIIGKPQVGSLLRCSAGQWSEEGAFTFSWVDSHQRAIPSAKKPTYRIRSSDIGRKISCVVTAIGKTSRSSYKTDRIGPIDLYPRKPRAKV